MRTLVIDTATEACSVALFEGGALVAQDHVVVGRGHAERLLPMVAALPDQGKAERIAVDVGPGSFTGVRIGIAAARALAFAWGSELTGYSALSMIAAAVRSEGRDEEDIAVAITGGHGELFWQIFGRKQLQPLNEPASTPILELARTLNEHHVFGTGAAALVEARGAGEAVSCHPDAANYPILPTALTTLPPRPIYGRGADARPMA
ncbi:MAG TPA: tRNA (adenosine(37)-N6)-threonylcarbamoyltransferase complex dimerization subunit type 1 TsaB [Rhizorhapis sp.]|nr:tRNA (adenosine(37)-N6)-threonylcarbamoyltransferase complex dimerization subunit type 1 TsaB [Rhizorhapis sp.]